jgi:ParB family chromosome partitioning protein
MALHENNRAEVVARLGWSENKLERRLALMNCVPEVQTALDEQKILLGHAELLAAAPQDKQNTVLGKIVEQNLSVATVKEALAKIAQRLDRAPFDTAGCLACSYNTSRQAMLFTEALAEGNCTNKACFLDKCMARVEELRKGLADEFPKVVVLAPGDPEIGVHVLPDGPMGVGIEQASACRGCAKFGATVNANPGKICEVERDVCFDEACRQEKVAAFLKARAKKRPKRRKKPLRRRCPRRQRRRKRPLPRQPMSPPRWRNTG